jgi:NTP pyrophosphatase (non-canonical NTP hydrolase)
MQPLETLGLVASEECGELCQAMLQARHEGGDADRIRQEAIDLGAVCLQILAHFR